MDSKTARSYYRHTDMPNSARHTDMREQQDKREAMSSPQSQPPSNALTLMRRTQLTKLSHMQSNCSIGVVLWVNKMQPTLSKKSSSLLQKVGPPKMKRLSPVTGTSHLRRSILRRSTKVSMPHCWPCSRRALGFLAWLPSLWYPLSTTCGTNQFRGTIRALCESTPRHSVDSSQH